MLSNLFFDRRISPRGGYVEENAACFIMTSKKKILHLRSLKLLSYHSSFLVLFLWAASVGWLTEV